MREEYGFMFNALLDRLDKLEPKGEKKSEKSDWAGTWMAYSDAYLERYGSHPEKNDLAVAMCRMLVGKMGREDASDLVRFYMAQRESVYELAYHDFALCLRDAEQLKHRMKHT